MSAPIVKFKISTPQDNANLNHIKLIEFDILKTKYELDKKILFEKQKLQSIVSTSIQSSKVSNEENLKTLITTESLKSLTGLVSYTDVALSNYVNDIDSKLAKKANKTTINALDEFCAVIDSSVAFQPVNSEVEFKYTIGGSFTGTYVPSSNTGSEYITEITEAEFLQINSTTESSTTSVMQNTYSNNNSSDSGYLKNINSNSSLQPLSTYNGNVKYYYSPKLKMYFVISVDGNTASRVVMDNGMPLSSEDVPPVIDNTTSMMGFVDFVLDSISNKQYIGYEEDLNYVMSSLFLNQDSTLLNEFLNLIV